MMNEVWSQMAEGAVAGPKGEPSLISPDRASGRAGRPFIVRASL